MTRPAHEKPARDARNQEILRRHESGESMRSLAGEYGLNPETVRMIVRKERWLREKASAAREAGQIDEAYHRLAHPVAG